MKNAVLPVLGLLVLLVCSSAFAQEEKAPPAPEPAEEQVAPAREDKEEEKEPYIEKIEGDCEYRASDDAEWAAAKKGGKVARGGALCTGFDSTVIVRFPGNSTLEVGSLTEVQISTFFRAKAQLEAKLKVSVGSVRVKVERGEIQSDFEVSTPHTTTSVKGTDWEVITSFYGDVIKVYENAVKATNNLGRKATIEQDSQTDDQLKSNAEVEREQNITPTVPLGHTQEEAEGSTVEPANQDKGPAEQSNSTDPDKERQTVSSHGY